MEAEISGVDDPIARTEEEKGISLRELVAALARTSDAAADAYADLRERWFERLLGPERTETPSSYHTAYMRRLSPLESIYTKEKSVEVCMDTLAGSASTSSRSRTSSSISTIARRSRRGPA